MSEGVGAWRIGRQVEASPVCGNALRSNGGGLVQRPLDGLREIWRIGSIVEQLLCKCLQPEHLMRLTAGHRRKFRGRAESISLDASVDQGDLYAGGPHQHPAPFR